MIVTELLINAEVVVVTVARVSPETAANPLRDPFVLVTA